MLLRLLARLLCVGFALFALHGCGGSGSNTTLASLTKLELSPTDASLPVGTSQAYTATAIFSDGRHLDVTTQTTWQTSDTSVATIDASGLARAIKTGSATISGSFQGQGASTGLTVTAAAPTSVSVSPSSTTIAKGTTQAFAAVANFTDGTVRDVTTQSQWASANSSVATVDNKGLATGVGQGTSAITAVFMGLSANAQLSVTAATLSSIEVTPATPSVAKGSTLQFKATGVFSDSTTQDITTSVTWGTTDSTVATISNSSGSQGRATTLKVGSTDVTAAAAGKSGSTTLTVTAADLASIQVTPANASVANGLTQPFTATGVFTDGSTQDITSSATWSSSDATVATISNASGSNGVAQSKKVGSVTITATQSDSASNPHSGTATLTVTAATLSRIDVTPANASVPVGTTQQFTATAVFSDNSHQDVTASAAWDSSDTSVIDVSNASGNQGLAAAKATGSATLHAVFQGVTGSDAVTVSNAVVTSIQVTPANQNLAAGFSLQYTATGLFSDNSTHDVTKTATWASSNTAAATISNASGSQGLATATKTPGSTSIKASIGTVVGTTSLTVTGATLSSVALTPSTPSAAKGSSVNFTATGTFSDSSKQDLTSQASWTSSSTAVATVSDAAGSKGQAKAVSVGSSTIKAVVTNAATSASGVTGSTTLTVTAATLSSLTVEPATASIAKGTSQKFTATGTFSDNSTQDITTSVTWSSSDSSVATISNTSPTNGQASGVAVGQVRITATSGSVSGGADLTVTAAALVGIAVTPANPSVAAGKTQQFTATGTFTDNSTQDITTQVTWSSDNTSVATVSNAGGSQGLATTITKGSANVAATLSGQKGQAALTVTNAVPVSMAVTPANQTIGNGTSQQFTATETFSDGTTQTVTANVTWSSSNTAVADISNAGGTNGLATAKSQGSVTITASDASVSPAVTGSTGLTVGPAALQSIQVSAKAPNDGRVPVGFKVQYAATGNFADGSTQDITASVSWSTFNNAIATVSNTTGSKGVVTGVAAGSTTVVASLGGVTGNAGVTVTNATLSSIAVAPASVTISGSNTQQFTATATFSDGSKLDATTQLTWASSNTSFVTIDQTGLAKGGTLPGVATITASRGSPAVTGQASVTHTP